MTAISIQYAGDRRRCSSGERLFKLGDSGEMKAPQVGKR
jgi:hypothetical protein